MPMPASSERKGLARRRRQLMQAAGDGAILILPAAPVRVRSRDTHYPYRQDSDFLYLTGCHEPDAVLVLVPGRKHGEALLFCRERDPEREGWDGPRLGTQGAIDVLGLDDAYPIDDIDEILPGLLEGRRQVHYHLGRDAEFDLKLIGWINRVRAQARHGAQPPQEFLALGHLLDEMRLFKTADEIRHLQRAADISVEAHRAAMRAVRPGMQEYALQAELEYVFRRHGAQPAYASIVGGGANACVLHYIDNTAVLRADELVLVDAGAEVGGYAADITRSFPVAGRFNKAQRALHTLVCAAQAAALAQARPGRPYEAGHDAAVTTLVEGLLSLGILQGDARALIASGAHKRYIRHKTGHWLGLDVHDVGEYRIEGASRLLEPGMVFTLEPGLYIPADDASVAPKWRGIGIRIEDDVLITRDGHRVLTSALERSADEVEALMAK
ncbi:MAG: aminopeptidase P N-terminal domain-containing protein [Xanthomonadaceae bacterium]|nr:aminopeptidase P N-terminal domain-containing protein [Xanthomonadaceae bacterium]